MWTREQIEAFDRKHGEQELDPDSGWIFYRDGAVRENSPYGMAREPHEDEYRRLKDIAHFFKLRLDRRREEFDRLKEKVLAEAEAAKRGRYDVAPIDPEGTIAKLEKLQKQVMVAAGNYGAAQKRADDANPRRSSDPVAARNRDVGRQAYASFAAQVREIEV